MRFAKQQLPKQPPATFAAFGFPLSARPLPSARPQVCLPRRCPRFPHFPSGNQAKFPKHQCTNDLYPSDLGTSHQKTRKGKRRSPTPSDSVVDPAPAKINIPCAKTHNVQTQLSLSCQRLPSQPSRVPCPK